MHVTIPKRLAERTGIRPGDAVVFEESPDDSIMIKKVAGARADREKVRGAFDNFSKDMKKIRPRVQEAEAALNESLSRYLSQVTRGVARRQGRAASQSGLLEFPIGHRLSLYNMSN